MFTEEEMKVISLLGEDGFDEHFFCAITPSPVRRVFLYLFAERYEIRRKGATLRFYLQGVGRHRRELFRSYTPPKK